MYIRWMGTFAVAIVSLPFLAEITRKYIYPSNLVLAVADALTVMVAVLLAKRIEKRIGLILVSAVLALMSWKLMSVAIGHQNMMLALVGLRNFAVPCAFLIIGLAIYRALGAARAAALVYKTFTIWLVIIGSVMVLQLVAGRDHWLNALPESFGDESAGIGDYTVGEVGIEDLFRPTAIFLHTGKLGPVIFVLTTYRLFYALATKKIYGYLLRGALLDVACLLLTGQRAAIGGYFIAAVIGVAIYVRQKLMLVLMLAVGLFVGALVGVSLDASQSRDSLLGEIGTIMLTRSLSVVSDIPWRIYDNVMLPMTYVWDRYALAPAGAGAFSLGSGAFGGLPLYEVVPMGTAENGWLRLLAEEGIVGLLGGVVFWTGLFLYAVRVAAAISRRHAVALDDGAGQFTRLLVIGAAVILGVFLLWSNTHDILGNTLAMSLCLVVFGVIGIRDRILLTSGRTSRILDTLPLSAVKCGNTQ